jgi:hypothetical protein
MIVVVDLHCAACVHTCRCDDSRLAKQAIDEHGGHVRAESGEAGTTITIALRS